VRESCLLQSALTVIPNLFVASLPLTPWLGLQLEGLHYAQTGVIQQD
jgi:hypothetical protein